MKKLWLFLVLLILLVSCKEKAMETVPYVDLEKFMGDWYVIAIIPNFMEKSAVNGIESYRLVSPDEVEINYRFSKEKLGGEVKHLTARAFIHDQITKAEWRVQFFWPIKFPYLIIDLAEDYRYTAIGVPNRKYVWIMSRTPEMQQTDYIKVLGRLAELGYDTARIRKMPQVWE